MPAHKCLLSIHHCSSYFALASGFPYERFIYLRRRPSKVCRSCFCLILSSLFFRFLLRCLLFPSLFMPILQGQLSIPQDASEMPPAKLKPSDVAVEAKRTYLPYIDKKFPHLPAKSYNHVQPDKIAQSIGVPAERKSSALQS